MRTLERLNESRCNLAQIILLLNAGNQLGRPLFSSGQLQADMMMMINIIIVLNHIAYLLSWYYVSRLYNKQFNTVEFQYEKIMTITDQNEVKIRQYKL